ncbi:MAG: hypothetical protein EOM22_00745 [Gammaproteobacteria bacterium]|nr:hypothetical protein [Gammaproteobacteria bacterium]
MAHAERPVATRDRAEPPRLSSALIALLVWIMILPGALAADTSPGAPVQHLPPLYGEPPAPTASTPWLDEVRAQRQAWELRRDASRSAYEARRRANHPRAAAQQEAWEEDVRRRRAARLERMDHDRDLFRSLGPSEPPPPWPFAGGMPAWPEIGSATPPAGNAGETPLFVPPGWNNHWYFRGF